MRYASTSFNDSLIGTTLAGRYRIEARVGSGAMGSVYRAHQSGLARRVAIKILNRDRCLAGDTVQRFRREAQAMSALHHPNTVRVFDFGSTEEGLLYLAMELLEGESLTHRLLRGGALGVREAVLVAQAVLRSVGEAHAHGIVHRDLKPDNIFLAKVQGEPTAMVKVLDFGIAKAIEGERKIDQFETLDGTVFGTPRYMSPEQAAGKALDHRSDLYAVGIMLFEFLAGRPPFVDADAVVVMARHIREAPPPLLAAAPDAPIPPCLQAVVEKALAKDPCERWQSAEEFERELGRCIPDVDRLQRLALRGWHKSWIAKLALGEPRRIMAWSLGAAVCLGVGSAVALPNLLGEADTVTLAATNGRNETPSPAPVEAAAINTPPTSVPPSATLSTTTQLVTLDSSPAFAQVFRNGSEVGITPLQIAIPAGGPLLVTLRKPGFADHSVELEAQDGRKSVTLLPLSPGQSAPQAKAATPKRERGRDRVRERERERERNRRSKSQPTAANGAKAQTPAIATSPYEKF